MSTAAHYDLRHRLGLVRREDVKAERVPLASRGAASVGRVAKMLAAIPLYLNGDVDELQIDEGATSSSNFMWLDEVYTSVFRNDPDRAIDILFERVDDMLAAGQYAMCDGLLKTIDVKRFDTNLLVGVLSITRRAAEQLRERKGLTHRIEDRLRQVAPDRIERLLSGLR